MPSRFVPRTLALATVAALAACAEPITEPETTLQPNFAKASSSSSGGATTAEGSNHIVVFASGIPEGFADDVAEAGGRLHAVYPEIGVAVVADLDARAAGGLKKASKARYVALEPMLALDEPGSMSDAVEAGLGLASADDPTTASFYPAQWNMWAIEAERAWAAGRLGASSTTVAILDSGVDYLHQDLAGRVDLSRSISFVPSDDDLVAAFRPGLHPSTDLRYHGTHVASIVASNGIGMAGVTSGVTLTSVKVCSVFGSCAGSAVFAGILYAIQSGADVANMSLGGYFTKSDFPGFVSVVQRLFNLAKQQGVTMVVAAGNAANDLDHDGNGFATYCNAANVVCVSATGPTAGGTFTTGPFENPDAPASYTNYGRSAIDVAAPGGNVTAVIGACSTATLFSALQVCTTSPTWYVGLAGTSMASPHAAGVAALIHGDVGRNPAQIRARLHQSADDLGQSGTDPFYGKGRVNAGNAVGAS